ncbi:MAG: hypothetical protein KIG74_09015 [Clostridiaceae bacterium]|nr:hypothetical protein [Clostridiaceae bacterium]
MTSQEKVAYLKGLMAGLELDPEKKETKVLNAIADVLDDIVHDMLDIEDDIIDLGDQVDGIDEDLTSLEDDFYDDEEDDEDEDEDEDDDDFFEIKCPGCGEELYIDGDILEEGSLECPKCGRVMEFHPVCDCGCDHCDDDCCEDGCCDGEDEDDD